MQYWIEYIILKIIIFITHLLPQKLSVAFGIFLGDFFFSTLRIRRDVTLSNLKKVFPEKEDAEIKQIGKNVYHNLGKTIVEIIRIPKIKKETIKDLFELDGIENLDLALSQGKGAILLTGHFGNWELIGVTIASLGYPLNVVIKPLKNPLVNKLVNDIRTSTGGKIISTDMALREIIKALRGNEFVAFVGDQEARGREKIIVNFLGIPSAFYAGPITFALKTGSPIIFGVSIRQKDGKHKTIIDKPIYIESSGNQQADLLFYTQHYADRLSYYIKEYPDQWFWCHRRWRDVG